MRIAAFTSYVVSLALKREIAHASAARRESRNVLVCCRLANGIEGWGEGVPRSYVTGETPEGAVAQLEATALGEQLSAECTGWDDVIALCQRFEPAAMVDNPRRCYGNSLRAAVELSILDAYGKLFGEPVSAVTARFTEAQPISTVLSRVRYSGAVTAESRRKEILSAVKMRVFGFAHTKVKVGMPGIDEQARLRRLRRWLGRRMDIRIDANEAWRAGEVGQKLEPLLAARISSVEQPVPHAEVGALAELRRQIAVPIMLDESLTSMEDGEAAIRDGTCDLFNLRLSKCGGYFACLRLAARARQAGLGYQLGCHPGESGILSAAGRHWASTVRDIRYLEGSYDHFMLKELPTAEDITFGYGGWAPALARPGLGVTMDSDVLARITQSQKTHRLD